MTEDPSFSLQARLQGLANLATSLSKPAAGPPEWPTSSSGAGLGVARGARKAKIVIIASEFLIRYCLVRCLQGSNGYVIEPLATVAEWIDAWATQPPPALILLCALGRNHDSAEIERDLLALSESGSKAPVVILSDIDDVNRMQKAFELGVRGYIPTNVPLDVALSALRVVEVGGTFVPASSLFEFRTQSACAATPRLEPRATMLTARQIAVGEAIRQGKANKQIAYELDMRESTVKVHIRNIMKKLNAKNRTEVAVKIEEFLRGAANN
jgi:DNA-binding NarL/FixJ family response regulator